MAQYKHFIEPTAAEVFAGHIFVASTLGSVAKGSS